MPIVFYLDFLLLPEKYGYLLVVLILFFVALFTLLLGIANGNDNMLLFPISIITIGYKRMYCDGVGYLWTRLTPDAKRIEIYSQGWLFLKIITYVDIDKDIERALEEVKEDVKRIFKQKIEEHNRREKIKSDYKKWDGILDLHIRREKDINKLLN